MAAVPAPERRLRRVAIGLGAGRSLAGRSNPSRGFRCPIPGGGGPAAFHRTAGGRDRGWAAVEGGDAAAVLAQERDPLGALARGEIPAVVVRGAFAPAQCAPLVRRLVERGLMRDGQVGHAGQANRAVLGPDAMFPASAPTGPYSELRNSGPSAAWGDDA